MASISSAAAESLSRVTPRARLYGLRDVRLVAVHAQNQHPHRGRATRDLARGLDPIQQRHADVEDGHVRIECQRLTDGVTAISGFGNHAPVASFFEDLSEPLA